jgi:hypothetical protein
MFPRSFIQPESKIKTSLTVIKMDTVGLPCERYDFIFLDV